MKEILIYTIENKMIYLVMLIVMLVFYIGAVYLDGKFRPTILKNNALTVLLTLVITVMGMLGFLNVMLG